MQPRTKALRGYSAAEYERIQQNAFYCGFDCVTMVNSVFAYGPDGKAFFCEINFSECGGGGTLTSSFLPLSLRGLVIIKSV